jgi:hypothetical protein
VTGGAGNASTTTTKISKAASAPPIANIAILRPLLISLGCTWGTAKPGEVIHADPATGW